jgi:S1-C subfamily serine protease
MQLRRDFHHVPLAIALALIVSASARAQTTQPAPLLEQISHETQGLYESIRPSLVVVQLPPPKWLTAAMTQQQMQMITKWGGQMDPALRQKLLEQAQTGNQANVNAAIEPSTQPSTALSNPRLRVVQRPDGGIDLVPAPQADDREIQQRAQGPRSLGVIYNDEGYVLVPYFIEREVAQDRAMKVYFSPGHTGAATFVGSDQKTNLTLLKLEKTDGKPIAQLAKQPPNGSMVMVLLTNGEAGQLLIWTGGLQDSGAVFGADGSLAGFSRAGQFLSGEQTRPIVDQLIKYGVVKRAVLGVTVRQIEGPTGQPAMLVSNVVANTPAARAGLQPGDVLVSLAGKSVTDVPTFAAAIAASDGPTEIEYLRGDQSAPIKVIIELRPQ